MYEIISIFLYYSEVVTGISSVLKEIASLKDFTRPHFRAVVNKVYVVQLWTHMKESGPSSSQVGPTF